MSDDLDKLLYSALHGLLPLKRRESLLRRYGGWMVIIPTVVYAVPFVISLSLLSDFVKLHYGQTAATVVLVFIMILAGYAARQFYMRRRKRVLPRIMAYLQRQGIRPHLCLICECDLRETMTGYCPECGTPVAMVVVDEDIDTSPRL